MEEGKCLVWVKRKHVLRPYFGARWEEQEFSGGGLVTGGTVHEAGWMTWPPRSYSCSFCKREFISAQALGGHMNVHRRDRAMLKQIQSNEPSDEANHDQDQDLLISSLSSQRKDPAPATLLESPTRMISNGDVLGAQTELSMCTGLGLSRAQVQEVALGGSFESLSCKRHKSSNSVSSLTTARLVFLKQCGDVFGAVEELDLELRLGEPPRG